MSETIETPEAAEVVNTPTSADDIWDREIVLPTDDDAPAEPLPDSDTPSEETATPETTDTDPDTDEAATAQPDAAEPKAEDGNEDEEDADDPIEKRLENHDPDKPVKLSRRQAAKVVESVIEPFRDANTPIEDVYNALATFQPVRTQELAEALVYNSLKAAPDAWLRELTGLDVTVEQVKSLVEGGGQPSNSAETLSEFDAAITQLNELYGDDWKDPANDDQLIGTDVPIVQAFRKMLETQTAQSSEADARVKELEEKLKALEPQVQEFATQREQEIEAHRVKVFETDVTEFISTVEQKAIPKVLDNLGLKPADSDTDEVKAIKSLIAERFSRDESGSSDFDTFLSTQFSQRELANKAIARVGNYLEQAATKEAEALKTPKQADKLKAEANALRAQAKSEQDALTVWAQKAATEFLDGKWMVLMKVLDKLAQSESSRNGRPEIVSATAGVQGGDWASQVREYAKNGGDPWEVPINLPAR